MAESELAVSLPCATIRTLREHLNGDDGWRSQIATQMLAADEAAVRHVANARAAAKLRETVVALGVLSRFLSAIDCPPSSKERR